MSHVTHSRWSTHHRPSGFRDSESGFRITEYLILIFPCIHSNSNPHFNNNGPSYAQLATTQDAPFVRICMSKIITHAQGDNHATNPHHILELEGLDYQTSVIQNHNTESRNNHFQKNHTESLLPQQPSWLVIASQPVPHFCPGEVRPPSFRDLEP